MFPVFSTIINLFFSWIFATRPQKQPPAPLPTTHSFTQKQLCY